MKFILGKKQAMTRVFDEKTGTMTPVTAIVAGPCFVSQIKTKKKDGVSAVQVVFDGKRRVTKPIQGHLESLPANRFIREFRLADDSEALAYKVGDRITSAVFTPGDVAQVIGTSKGKGFQGVVKRHHFKGSPKTHGHKDQLRMPGSIGATAPQRVPKGKRMAGHMGAERVSIKNLDVIKVEEEKNLIFLRGAIPGARGGLVILTGAGTMTPERNPDIAAEVKKEEVHREAHVITEDRAS